MRETDVCVKQWLSDKVRFADLFNAAIYDGEQIFTSENLEILDITESAVLKDQEDNNVIVERFRDINMKTRLGTKLILLACENQTEIHYAMPIRNMLYDALHYTEQVKRIAKKNRNDRKCKSSAEFLSGMLKDDRIEPIITLVFYYGQDEWDGSLDLHGLLDVDEEEYEKIKDYIPNYKINLIDAVKLTREGNLHSDLQMVLGMLEYRKDKEKIWEYINANRDYFENIDVDSYNAARVLLGTEKQLKEVKKEEKGEMDMCKALDDWYQDGVDEAEARTKRIFKLYIEGKKVEEIASLCNVTVQKVEEVLA